ncbi:LysR family transcriptional regulator [Actinocrispum wychmicini]|uniref:DNA-binding transcriptional LysR family regulator n=1 Tax=Actinocrispum wychmicini TaxID=1213861 RepID=A0A4R2JLW3_9PSEU|nr:LysR family transcriptional regulator [Actinocrispum wychmicini]TCO61041.1 DNA-binding transcriptional LysR family regulator [Actinocrispum wychmicini]
MAVPDLQLDDVAVFVRVVDTGGFTAAADTLHLPKSTVSRRVARLERRLGTRLLNRTTRAVTPTEAGRSFYARASAALAELHDAASAAFDEREIPRGTVRLGAPPDVGAEVLPALLARFVEQHPQVRVEVTFFVDPPDLVEHGLDVGLQVGPPHQPALVAVQLQDMGFGLFAAPSYLEREGAPGSVAELADRACVVFRPDRGRGRWRLYRVDDHASAVDVVVRGPLAANDITFVRRAAIAGAGVALLPRLVGEIAVQEGQLCPVLPEYRTDGQPLYLVSPASPHVPLKVRALRDFLLGHFPR